MIDDMLRSQIESCAIPVWYSHFRPVTFETQFVQLTPDFLAYLLADGVVLPPSLIPTQRQPDSSDESEVFYLEFDLQSKITFLQITKFEESFTYCVRSSGFGKYYSCLREGKGYKQQL